MLLTDDHLIQIAHAAVYAHAAVETSFGKTYPTLLRMTHHSPCFNWSIWKSKCIVFNRWWCYENRWLPKETFLWETRNYNKITRSRTSQAFSYRSYGTTFFSKISRSAELLRYYNQRLLPKEQCSFFQNTHKVIALRGRMNSHSGQKVLFLDDNTNSTIHDFFFSRNPHFNDTLYHSCEANCERFCEKDIMKCVNEVKSCQRNCEKDLDTFTRRVWLGQWNLE